MVKVAINGYGRIGRVAHRIILQKHPQLEVVALNAGSSTDLQGWAYLLKYDSTYGVLPNKIDVVPNTDSNKPDLLGMLVVDGKQIPVFSQKDATLLPWRDLAVDVVIESTGHFLTTEKAKAHIDAGAKKVVMSAPAKDDTPPFVLSVNDSDYANEPIVSNESCTTNCISPVAKVIEDVFGIEKAMMTTIHAYTSDQKLQDGGHKDYRRARAAAHNIIPTTSGATHAAGQVVPSLQGIFNGLALRVPVPTGSLSDFTFLLKKEVSVGDVNTALKNAAASKAYEGILAVTTDPIVSSDVIGDSHSSIVDLSLTQVVGGNMVKVIAWYDNEWGYTSRLVEMVEKVGTHE
ncbi:MAG TPA: type I glyceraldehyde-3-phosphate dehydrogenase [Candidatus Saccharimonadales bacterium]|nr:type I glyceraldehyde-3-phosphate dehydrogenase [Candidatus Saccharimonadales bacterium]